MLTARQIDQIEQAVKTKLRTGEDGAFARLLRHVNTVMLSAEKLDMDNTKDWLFQASANNPTQRVRLDAWDTVKGELELSLLELFEAADKGKPEAAYFIAVRLMGTYWERVFCRRLGIQTGNWGVVYRAQKWHPLGAATLAAGKDQVEGGRLTLPDVMLIIEKRLIFAEVKHETLTTEEHGSIGAGYYGLSAKDWRRIKRLLQLKPPVPYWFIIHEHKRLGRWNVMDELQDWLVGDFRVLGEPKTSSSSTGATTDWSGEAVRVSVTGPPTASLVWIKRWRD